MSKQGDVSIRTNPHSLFCADQCPRMAPFLLGADWVRSEREILVEWHTADCGRRRGSGGRILGDQVRGWLQEAWEAAA